MARTDTAASPAGDQRGRYNLPRPPVVARWLPATSLTIAAIGLAIAAYLTVEHYTASTTLACSDSGTVNCLKVTTSAQSKVLGIPVALLGLLYFVAMIGLCLPAAWRARRPVVRNTRIAAATIGVGFVFYLIYAELFEIGNICLWCTGVHVLAIGLFAVVVFGAASIDTSTR